MLRMYAAATSGIQYFGKWVLDGTRRYTSQQFSKCIFSFTGSTVRVYVNACPNGGRAKIFVDGEEIGRIDCQNDVNLKKMLFEKTDVSGERIHEIAVVSEKVYERPDAVLEICAFEAEKMVDYPQYIRDLKLKEYALIEEKKKGTSDASTWKKVPYRAAFPKGGVKLKDRIFSKMLEDNKKIIKKDFFELPFYCEGEGPDFDASIPGPGWSHFLPASNEGRLLAGAYNALLWEEDEELREMTRKIVSDMKARMREDGFFNYYSEAASFGDLDSPLSERKNYDRVFWTRAMLYAHEAGDPETLELARRMYDWLEKAEEYLPTMIVGTNATNAGPGVPLMANSDAGKDSDMLTAQKYFDQDYFFETLTEGQSMAFSAYPGHQPHCYALLIVETLVDEYRATGEKKYLDAMLGGWEIWRKYYKHIGGAATICEVDGPYPPGSYYLTTGHNGETCATVFWCLINMRLMQLFPGEEKYARELEEALFNAIAACRTAEDGWTRYHIRFHGEKEWGRNFNTCCEVSSTMFIPTIPGYIYSADEKGVYVNLFIASDYEGEALKISQKTDFPYCGKVLLKVSGKGTEDKTLRIRIPDWQKGTVEILLNGEKAAEGIPGSYAEISRVWGTEDTVEVSFDLSPRMIQYTGFDQPKDNTDRFVMLCGPTMMALTGVEKEEVLPLRNRLTIEPTIPRIYKKPQDVLNEMTEEAPLNFSIDRFRFVPYYTLDKEYFTCYPIIEE